MPTDIAFTSFRFPVSGGTTGRTAPARFADIINVLDFGADPTRGAPSTAAIRAAITAATAGSVIGGTFPGNIVFFPHGHYLVDETIVCDETNSSFEIRGAGRNNTTIEGTVNGFILSKSDNTNGLYKISDIKIINYWGAGASAASISGTTLTINGTSISGMWRPNMLVYGTPSYAGCDMGTIASDVVFPPPSVSVAGNVFTAVGNAFVGLFAVNQMLSGDGVTPGTIITAFGTASPTGNVANNQTTITNLSSMSMVASGMVITGTGIPAATKITGVDYSASTITISNQATATNNGVTLTITSDGHGGTYILNNSMLVNGSGLLGVYIYAAPGITAGTGNTAGNTFTLSQNVGAVSATPMSGGLGTGAVRMQCANEGIIENFDCEGFFGIDSSINSFGTALMNGIARSSIGQAIGTVGVSGGTNLWNVRLEGCDIGFLTAAANCMCLGCTLEECVTGMKLGLNSTFAVRGLTGAIIGGFETEGCLIGVDIVQANSMQLFGAVITSTTNEAATYEGSKTSDALYGITMTNCGNSAISSVSANPVISGDGSAGVDLAHFSSGGTLTFENVSAATWAMPTTNNPNYWGFKFINCDNPSAAMTISALPGKAGVANNTPVEGMEYDIIDCPGSGAGGSAPAPTFGQVITGPGSAAYHARVRYNGTAWTVMGV